MIRFKVSIEGRTPLLLNRFSDEAAMAATSGTRASMRGDAGSERELAQAKLYLDDKENIVIPQPNLMRCIVDGGTWHKLGKKQVTTKRDSLVYACLDIVGVSIPLIHKAPWSVDARPVVIPATGGRILCYRPRFDDWKLSFEMELDETIIGAKLLRAIVDDAGSKCGIGDFRPNRKGPFGRFLVTNWEQEGK